VCARQVRIQFHPLYGAQHSLCEPFHVAADGGNARIENTVLVLYAALVPRDGEDILGEKPEKGVRSARLILKRYVKLLFMVLQPSRRPSVKQTEAFAALAQGATATAVISSWQPI
jgi:hypothetical protein